MIGFSLQEGARNFRNLGITGLLTLVSLTVTLLLVGISARGYLLLKQWSNGLLGRFEIEAFLVPDADSSLALEVAAKISVLPEVATVRYISKTEAALRFGEQFSDELLLLLDYNPLPPSLIVTLSEKADLAVSWAITARSIAMMEGVEDVLYEGDLLAKVERFYRKTGLWVMAAVGATLAVSLLFTFLTVSGVIRSREEFIRIVSLSGGTRAMARGPFVMLGGYYGAVAGVAAALMVEGLVWILKLGWGVEVAAPVWCLPAVIVLGIVIGMVGAALAAASIKEY